MDDALERLLAEAQAPETDADGPSDANGSARDSDDDAGSDGDGAPEGPRPV